MATEMDLLKMDERERNAWLLANRTTLMLVGLVWIGMILWEASKGRVPLFLIVMVPVFGWVRWALYRRHVRRVT